MTKPTLRAVILTHNERRHIGDCIDSLTWADEIVLFDSFSDDGTPDLARARGARVLQHPFVNFARQRDAALEAVDADWIFFVDADERIPPELAAEVRQVIAELLGVDPASVSVKASTGNLSGDAGADRSSGDGSR